MPEPPGSRAGAERGGVDQPAIPYVAIDGALFLNEVEARQIMAVPTMFPVRQVFGQRRSGVKEILCEARHE